MEGPSASKRKRSSLPVINRLNYEDDSTINIVEAGICGIKSTEYFMEIFQNLDPQATFESNIANYFKHKHGYSDVFFVRDPDNRHDIRVTISGSILVLSLPQNIDKVSTVLGLFPSEAVYVHFNSNDMIVDENPAAGHVSMEAFTFIILMNIEDVVLKHRDVPGLYPLRRIFIWPTQLNKKATESHFVL